MVLRGGSCVTPGAMCAPAIAISSCRRRAGSSPDCAWPGTSHEHRARRAAGVDRPHPGRQQILTDVVAGLSRTPRQLPSKYFYDARGSRLFEQITQTCEYYPTRTELALLARVLPDIARSVGPHVHVVELGSGSGRKTALLLAALQDPVAYTPSRSRAPRCCPASTIWPRRCRTSRCCRSVPTSPARSPSRHRNASLRGACCSSGLHVGQFRRRGCRRTAARDAPDHGPRWPGSGRHRSAQGPGIDRSRLQRCAGHHCCIHPQPAGAPEPRDRQRLRSDGFRHRARYSVARLRIETDLVSQRAQDVRLDGRTFHFQADEPIRVEYSHKYTDDSFEALLLPAGLQVVRRWDAESPAYGLRLLRAL